MQDARRRFFFGDGKSVARRASEVPAAAENGSSESADGKRKQFANGCLRKRKLEP